MQPALERTPDRDAGAPAPRARLGPRALVAGFWALLALAAAAQVVVERVVLGGSGDRRLPLGEDLWLLAMWALAAPAIVWSARRWPVRGPDAGRRAALHVVAATAFIVATNVAIRLPLLLPPDSVGAQGFARDVLLGLARFYPAALVVYGALVAVGQRALGPPLSALGHGGAEAGVGEVGPTPAPPHPTPAPSAAESREPTAESPPCPARVVVREWNRVHLVRPDDIAWVEADDNYVVVHAAGRTYKGRGRISDIETQLDPSRFVRVHRSAIVRVESIREVQPLTKGDLALVLRDGKVLRVARGRRAVLERALSVEL